MNVELGNERNEVGWWSNWAEAKWFTPNCYALRSTDFREPLFNHAGFTDPHVSLEGVLPAIRKWFEALHSKPSFFLQENHEFDSYRKALRLEGYSRADNHIVMLLTDPRSDSSDGVTCSFIDEERADDWADIYLSAFYGENSLARPVTESVKKALRGRGSRLMLAEVGGKPAGVLAVYSEMNHSGVYCVGTLPEFRKRGVASKMLTEACKSAPTNSATLTLQTFASDNVESFYLKRGFARAYSKEVITL